MSTDETEPTSVAETLRRARALIEDPKRWCKGALAKPTKRSDDYLDYLAPDDPKAGAWCAIGAIKRIDGPWEHDALVALASAIAGLAIIHNPDPTIYDFNDGVHRRHRDVMAKFDRAIALAEKQEVVQ